MRQHYEVERELADRLRAAPPEERGILYGAVYDELFRRVPLHPQLTRKTDPAAAAAAVERQLRMLARFLRPETVFLEIGAGDCALSIAVARRVRKVYAVDVSDEILQDVRLPGNAELLVSDGTSIPVDPCTVDVAYSNQLLEHLHPDDAVAHVRNAHDALKPGGVYVCVTPDRRTGPHDVSQYFSDTATGFHLREYAVSDLEKLLRGVGFRDVRILAGARGRCVVVPTRAGSLVEAALGAVPATVRRGLLRQRAVRLGLSVVLGIRIVATRR